MSEISSPKYVLAVLERLNRAGESAYMVGGCVRDVLLGRRPKDWDVCTSASPERVLELFPRAHPTGIKHGTVTVISRGSPVEVTTYRTDGPYTDHRHPKYVEFVKELPADLSRRDFTINAMAMDSAGNLIDLFSGQEDLAKGLIRCVGEPEKRFSEDALRMLRAVRFSAELGFEIEEGALSAISAMSRLVSGLAPERVQAELTRVLLSPRPEKAEELLRLGLIPGAVRREGLSLEGLSRLPKSGKGRWAAFCGVLTEKGCISDPREFLAALRLDSETVKTASQGALLALESGERDSLGWKKLLSRWGEDTCLAAACAMDALEGAGHRRLLRSVLKSGECYSLKELKIDGRELQTLGFRGVSVGEALKSLLDHVLVHPEDNSPERLRELAEELLKNRNM